MALNKIKILGAVLELPAKGQLISKVFGVNLAHLPQNWAKWAELTVLLS